MKIAFVYAGQGSQIPGMGKDLYEQNETFRQTVDEIDTDGSLRRLCFEADMATLSDTRNTQPCMVLFAVALTKVLYQQGIRPELAAGLSLGEYSALFAAGVFDEKTAVDLVRFRAQAMADAVVGIESKMTAVLHCESGIIEEACRQASEYGVVEIANYNCPGQIVIAGEKRAVEKAEEILLMRGAKRCVPLVTGGPFHTTLMKPAGVQLSKKMSEILFSEMNFPVVFNCTAKPLNKNERIQDLLVRQVQSSVLFEDTIRYMQSWGIQTIVEIGPGRVLNGFIKKTSKSIQCYSIENCETLDVFLNAMKGDANER